MTDHQSISKHLLAAASAAALLGTAVPAAAETVHAKLTGYEEVPAVSSPGSGEFRAKIDKRSKTISYELNYEDTQGLVFMAHIHLAQRGVNGGIVVWLCGNGPAPVPPTGTQTCPAEGKISGTIAADSSTFTGAPAQLLAAGEFDELVDAIRAGVAYVNVHTTAERGVPGGEIRGQIR